VNPPASGASPARRPGPVAVVTAVPGATESAVAAALSGRSDLVLVRRCADVAELVSVAEAGLAGVAVIGDGFPRLDADVVDRVRRCGVAVIGVVDPDRESSERLRAWGLDVVEVSAAPAPDGPEPEVPLVGAVLAAVPALDAGLGGPGDVGPVADVRGARPPDQSAPTARASGSGYSRPLRGADTPAGTPAGIGDPGRPRGDDPDSSGEDDDGTPVTRGGTRGRLVAVWGPAGAPGRTTVAVTVAAELAADGSQVLLVDADTYAASVAQVLGLLDESPGLVAAVRAGLDGRLDPSVLARLAPTVAPGLRVLTGLTRAARWSELRPAGLQAVLAAARALVDPVVVDLATPLEEDDELSYDTAAPRRNGTTLEVLRAADHVVVVGSADPVGLQRLVRGLQDLAVAVPGVAPEVVVNKVRSDSVGRNPRLRVREALDRFAGVRDLRLVPDDRQATDRALLAGRSLTEAAPDSPARASLQALARGLGGHAAPATTRRGRRLAATGG
jgi:MinD-like ATPase involved in chromosome partitioning or flagellar assembly